MSEGRALTPPRRRNAPPASGTAGSVHLPAYREAGSGGGYRQRQRAPPVEHLGHPRPAADRRFEVAPAELLLLNHEQDRADRIRRRDRDVRRLVRVIIYLTHSELSIVATIRYKHNM